MADPDVFTTLELAARWRVTRQSIMEMINGGRLHAFRIGAGKKARYRVPRVEVERVETEGANQNVAAAEPARRAGGR